MLKASFLRQNNSFTLCLVAGDKKASLNKIKKDIETLKTLTMASADEVKNTTGFTIGGVSPIGHLSNN
ncbi:MAG: YbaK/EbsC family protein [Candidatus Pelagibacter sp.]